MKQDFFKDKKMLYHNAWSREMTLKNKPDIIWREHDIDEEIDRFRIVYEKWCNQYPERIRCTGGRHPREKTADDYIKMFLAGVELIQDEAERLNWPWEWCIDLSLDARYFNPKKIILGDSRMYSLSNDGARIMSASQEQKKGKNCKDTTRLNNRYRTYCVYDSKSPDDNKRRASFVNVEEFVCNYFRLKPNINHATLEAGHVFGFDPNYSCIVNNNMHNVHWQTANDNRSTQRLFDNHNYKKLIANESKKSMDIRGIPVALDEPSPYRLNVQDMLNPNMEELQEYGIELGYEFSRNEDGLINQIRFVQDRLIVPVIN